jgi:sulfur-oxidizing protein SoxZ
VGEPTRIRASLQGDKALVRVLMTHEMESGQRKDADGKLVPAHFIREVTVRHNGRPVLSAQWGPAVSKNPYLQFAFAGARPGDRIQVSWLDTKGDTRTDETAIS